MIDARRGAPDRVRKKSNEFIDKALSQNARTINYLTSGAGGLRNSNGRQLVIPNSPNITSVIVTLDRVDPFATHMPDGGKRDAVPDDGTWLVNLADLLMVADILRHPAEFYAYAEIRARINKSGAPMVFVEADALGLWCEQRITPTTPQPGQLILLNTTSEAMNNYFTHVPTDPTDPPPRSGTGVPREVLAALDDTLHQRPESWHSLTVDALSVPPANWSPVTKALKNTDTTRMSRRARKHARRAGAGLRVTDTLTVYVNGDHQHAPLSDGSNDLIITSQPARTVVNG